MSAIKSSDALYINYRSYSAYTKGRKIGTEEPIDICVGWFIGENPDVPSIIERIKSASKLLHARTTTGKVVILKDSLA